MKRFLTELIRAQTTAQKGELTAAKVISDELRRSQIDSNIDRWDQTRANISAHIKSGCRQNAFLFACHLDVVGPGEAIELAEKLACYGPGIVSVSQDVQGVSIYEKESNKKIHVKSEKVR